MGVVFAICISTHYLTQRQTGSPLKFCLNCIFQLTTSHRGRLNKEHFEEKKMLFQLTTSHRGRHLFPVISSVKDLFQLTTSHRGRRLSGTRKNNHTQISTHYLTQRQTTFPALPVAITLYFNSLPHTEIDHVLPSVRGRNEGHFNSLPHTEVDCTEHCNNTGNNNFNSLPHTEVDGGLWRAEAMQNIISTHYLTQRQTMLSPRYSSCFIFQLTTSHRGRRSSTASR